MSAFDPIRPGDIDNFLFDFTNDIGATGVIAGVVWSCTLSPNNVGIDLTPAARLIGSVVFDNHKTSHQAGTMLNGVIYTLLATATINDGRILTLDGDVECAAHPSPEDLPLTIEQFRASYPAFASTTFYPDEQVGYWINQAVNFSPLDQQRWGQFYDMGLRLYVAHNLALERMGGLQAATGGAPVGAGVPQSKSVGGVSISYDVEFGSETDAGAWGLTIWGSRFLRLLREAGAAPIQL